MLEKWLLFWLAITQKFVYSSWNLSVVSKYGAETLTSRSPLNGGHVSPSKISTEKYAVCFQKKKKKSIITFSYSECAKGIEKIRFVRFFRVSSLCVSLYYFSFTKKTFVDVVVFWRYRKIGSYRCKNESFFWC